MQYLLLFLVSFLVSQVLLNCASLRASGSKSGRSTYLPCLMVLTRCRGMGGRPDTGSTRSVEASSAPSAWGGVGDMSCSWTAGVCEASGSLGWFGCFSQSGAVAGSPDSVPSVPVEGNERCSMGGWGTRISPSPLPRAGCYARATTAGWPTRLVAVHFARRSCAIARWGSALS